MDKPLPPISLPLAACCSEGSRLKEADPFIADCFNAGTEPERCLGEKGVPFERGPEDSPRPSYAHILYQVELVVSPNVMNMTLLKGTVGYHTSILVEGEEFVFSPQGITCALGVYSHDEDAQTERIPIGTSRRSGAEMADFFDISFPSGHYDLLRKNCNSFSDCALYFLCGQRLDTKYLRLDQLGKLADDGAGIIQLMSAGEYLPNPKAVGFDLEAVMANIDSHRDALAANEGGLAGMAEVTIALSKNFTIGGMAAVDDKCSNVTGMPEVTVDRNSDAVPRQYANLLTTSTPVATPTATSMLATHN